MDMDVINNIKETLSKAKDTVVSKSGEIVEITKLKYSIADMEGDISKLMRAIGEKVYEAYKNGTEPDESINEFCAEISAKYAEIDEKRAKVRALKKEVACKSCGNSVDKDAAFCPKCGEKLN